jgi:hypothetical protein
VKSIGISIVGVIEMDRLNLSRFSANAKQMSRRQINPKHSKKILWACYSRLRIIYLEKLLEIASLKRRVELLETQRFEGRR